MYIKVRQIRLVRQIRQLRQIGTFRNQFLFVAKILQIPKIRKIRQTLQNKSICTSNMTFTANTPNPVRHFQYPFYSIIILYFKL